MVSEENQYFPARMVSVRILGNTKSMVVVDGIGGGVEAQKLVGRGIRAGGMRAHAKTVRNRLKVLLLLMDTVAAAPPPGLMHESGPCAGSISPMMP